MSRERDLLELSLLYDTARGFLSAGSRAHRIRHALLSVVGYAGAQFAAFLEPRANGRFESTALRGLDEVDVLRLELPSTLVTRMASTGAPQCAGVEPCPAQGWAATARRDGSDPSSQGATVRIRALLPILSHAKLLGMIALGAKLVDASYSREELGVLAEIAELTAGVLAEPTHDAPPPARGADPTTTDSAAARDAAGTRKLHPALRAIQGEGPATVALYDEILSLASVDLAVLIMGETGTGKELVARALHDLSPRAKAPFEAVNCAAIPRDLIASTLFGHERGAFTGAMSRARGAFELAGDGTLFLDEIGDMPLDTQSNLLRVLQERRFRRVGGESSLHARCRVISATNVDLRAAVESNRFRADLFYRLQVYCVRLQPLRQRHEDVPALVQHVLAQHATAHGVAPRVTREFLDALCRLELRGNVRELESLVLGAVLRARGGSQLTAEHLPRDLPSFAPPSPQAPAENVVPQPKTSEPSENSLAAPVDGSDDVPSYEEMERKYVQSVLQLTDGNKKRAAEIMGIPRTTLNARMRKLNI